MTDNFLLLDEPRRPWLDADALKRKFLARSAEVHPDRTHNAGEAEKLAANQRYTALNAAYNCLREPKDRVRHLLELELGQKPSDLTNVPDDMMDLFFEVGKVFRETDVFLAEKGRATSPMLQVQLFERGQDWVEKLGGLREKIAGRRDALLEELRSIDAIWKKTGEGRPEKVVSSPSPHPSPRFGGERETGEANRPLERLLVIWRLLSFYERWLGQIQERVVQLSF